uniref:CCHC-type domain-containing protein n=1 Tax=Cannabis sativa TaxID=3483 RepID=A0A803Q7N1_CANSA
MSSSKFEIDKFNGTIDFGLWRIKMKALLVHRGISEALDIEALAAIDDKKKKFEIETKAHSAILLSLGDEVLREVPSEEKALHFDDYNKIILDLCNIGVKIDDEDQEIMLLSSLPKAYEHFVETILYGKDSLTMTEVKAALSSKEIQRKEDNKIESSGEGLFTRGRSTKREYKGNKNHHGNGGDKAISGSRNAAGKQCYYCKKEGHFRDDCLALKAKLKREQNKKNKFKGEVDLAADGYESANVLVASSMNSDEEWILDSGSLVIVKGKLRNGIYYLDGYTVTGTSFAHIRQDKLQPRSIKCLFLGYPDGIKGYKLWCLETGFKKCIISRDVVLREDEMAMKVTTIQTKIAPATETNSNSLQLEVEPSNDSVQTQDNQIDESQDRSDDDQEDLSNYQLARDRERREIKPPDRLEYAEFIAFALTIADEIDSSIPSSYYEAINGKNGKA